MSGLTLGPRTTEQLARLGSVWDQGQHVLITGSTGSGKSVLGRKIVQRRIERGGHVVVMVAKTKEDKTITDEYPESEGWVRWKTWKKRPASYETKILLWPDVRKLTGDVAILAHQKKVFGEALDAMGKTGLYTLVIDEGLYTTAATFLNFEKKVAMLHAMGRSAKLTIVTLAQRPSHLPLIIYGSASHVFCGRTREDADLKRLKELGGKQSAKELAGRLSELGRHDFIWIPVAEDWDAEDVNLKK